MPISQTGTSTKYGFTLIELVIVIFILSLFFAIAVPSFKGTESYDMKAEVKRIASILRYLYDTAITTKQELYLIVNFNDSSISYTTQEGERRERIKYLTSVFLETAGRTNDGSVKIIFTPTGTTEFLRFHFTGNIVVVLNPISGRVKIDEM